MIPIPRPADAGPSQEATVYGPEPIELRFRRGARYWVHHPCRVTGRPEIDERLSDYPVAVFLPPGRRPAETPVLIGLQGLAAPYHWNGMFLPTLLDMGIACVLFDTPLGGERSLLRLHDGNVLAELEALQRGGVRVTPGLVRWMFEAVARDFGTVTRLIADRHGLTDPRRALFGVSLGTLLSAYAFLRHGVGVRLLGTIGHADLPRFARSYAARSPAWLGLLPVRLFGGVAVRLFWRRRRAGWAFLRVLQRLAGGRGTAGLINPMRYADRAGEGRRVRFLVGEADPVVRPADATACAARFPDGECYVVPGLAHGGDAFFEHARYFLATQLGDWAW
ncbi:MAG TPA: hypothetical protein VIL46_03835 [Gemmataceae bacterium]